MPEDKREYVEARAHMHIRAPTHIHAEPIGSVAERGGASRASGVSGLQPNIAMRLFGARARMGTLVQPRQCMLMHVHTGTPAHPCGPMRTRAHTRTCASSTDTCLRARMHLHMSTCPHLFVYTLSCADTGTHGRTRTHTRAQALTCAPTCAHTHDERLRGRC